MSTHGYIYTQSLGSLSEEIAHSTDCTLFPKRSAHWFTPILLVTLGHWPWPRVQCFWFTFCQVPKCFCQVPSQFAKCQFGTWHPFSQHCPVMSILSNGLDSNMQKTPCKNSLWFKFRHGLFWELISRPIDKIKMTRGRGRWPRDLRKLGCYSCALLLEKSVYLSHLYKDKSKLTEMRIYSEVSYFFLRVLGRAW